MGVADVDRLLREVRGQVTGSLPVYGARAEQRVGDALTLAARAARPRRRVASMCAASSASGSAADRRRPRRRTLGGLRAHRVRRPAVSLVGELHVLDRPRHVVVARVVGPLRADTSPKPSAYGVSPTTTTPTAFCRTGSEASWLKVTFW